MAQSRAAVKRPRQFRPYNAKKGGLDTYFRSLSSDGSAQKLPKEEELRLARRFRSRGDITARNKLIVSNLAFVVSVAEEYRDRGVPFEDLVSEGNLAFVQESPRFNPDRGVRYVTYMTWWLRKVLGEVVAKRSRVMYVPKYRFKQISDMKNAERNLRQQLGREPRRHEIAELLGKDPAEFETFVRTNPKQFSLDDHTALSEHRVKRDSIPDHRTPAPSNRLARIEDHTAVSRALATLAPIERQIVDQRFGLNGTPPITLAAIGLQMGISRERVRQLEVKAKAKLKSALNGTRHRRSR